MLAKPVPLDCTYSQQYRAKAASAHGESLFVPDKPDGLSEVSTQANFHERAGELPRCRFLLVLHWGTDKSVCATVRQLFLRGES
jgi:hypothetical protein